VFRGASRYKISGGNMRKQSFNVLVATDASRSARAGLAATLAFPWPDGTQAQGVMVSGVSGLNRWRRRARAAFALWLRHEAGRVQRRLRRRWADAEVVVVNPPVVKAIVERARRWRADVIVLGSRGRGSLQRAFFGSVSRDVMHEADCAVLVVKGKTRAPRRLLIGLDGSVRSRRAVAFASRLPPPPGGRVRLLAVVEPTSSASLGRLPGSVRSVLAAELAALNREQMTRARRELSLAARRLTREGWAVEKLLRRGIPLSELLRAAATKRTDITIVGARGATGLERLLLGSVAEGTLAHSPGSVLVVK
jgi:nucleotide-binding universal stress UspA family protein